MRVFYSYSRLDAKQLQKLKKHLSPLERIDLIHGWCDNEILPGAEFDQEIADKLGKADIVVLLISPNFSDSQYCYKIELQRAMERRDVGEAEVLPVIISPTTAWKKLKAGNRKLGELNALPTSGKPIPSWNPNQEFGWKNVADGVERLAEELTKKKRQR
ncbi:MAG: toll/interleukin-1 receptor domain-containing protein [Planctomycetaceae bacterium]|nr:toll/interleukin-1 receptor domain-containing protein [Planctomycetaceae bacterium]